MHRTSPRTPALVAALLVLAMVLASCGGSDPTDVTTGAEGDSADRTEQDSQGENGTDGAQPLPADDTPIPVEPDGGIGDGAEPLPGDETPIPVEPDGGIGDGAEPLPGAEEPVDTGTWHGPEVAETNCPGTEWQRVQASEFSFSVPADFVEADVQPIDSEIGMWNGPTGMTVNYDYGWYSGSVSSMPGAESEPIDYSGIAGEFTVIRQDEASDEPNMVEVYFGEVAVVDSQTDKLSMLVTFPDADDEIIARCIVGSIAWG